MVVHSVFRLHQESLLELLFRSLKHTDLSNNHKESRCTHGFKTDLSTLVCLLSLLANLALADSLFRAPVIAAVIGKIDWT